MQSSFCLVVFCFDIQIECEVEKILKVNRFFRVSDSKRKTTRKNRLDFAPEKWKDLLFGSALTPLAHKGPSLISMSSPVKFPLILQSKLYSVTHYPTYLTFSQPESKSDLAEGVLCSIKGIYIIKQDLETFSSSGNHCAILQNGPSLKIKNGQNPIMRI